MRIHVYLPFLNMVLIPELIDRKWISKNKPWIDDYCKMRHSDVIGDTGCTCSVYLFTYQKSSETFSSHVFPKTRHCILISIVALMDNMIMYLFSQCFILLHLLLIMCDCSVWLGSCHCSVWWWKREVWVISLGFKLAFYKIVGVIGKSST